MSDNYICTDFEEALRKEVEKVYKETSIVRPPIDYIGLGTDTKGMELNAALQKALREIRMKEAEENA